MKYFKLNDVERKELMESLAGMKNFLLENFGSLTHEEARVPGPKDSFSPVEQVWHLADLEQKGFGLRIKRLQSEQNPHLPDFDGDKLAKERNYRSLSLLAGLRAFEAAREANLSYLHTLSLEDWSKTGTQEGVGDVSLCDMPVFIRQHDRAHVDEILAWKSFVARRNYV
jgi:hypothetical protein